MLDHIPLVSLKTLAGRSLVATREQIEGSRESAWRLLDVLRRSSLLCRIVEAEAVDEWAKTILHLVEVFELHFWRAL